MKPALIKRVLQLAAILYQFGISDLFLEFLAEKVILAVKTLSRDDDRIATKLLKALLPKDSGFWILQRSVASMQNSCCISE